MSGMTHQFPTDEVTAAFIPPEDNCSPEFARYEAERLWPFVWQIACRLEEIPKVGDFVTYDIVDDSIVVIRTSPTEIKAYHNVCPHRGRQLTEGCGRTKMFKCRFHGWEFDLQGNNTLVIDRKDFGSELTDDKVHLKMVQVDTWAGFVYINMDADCEPLQDFIAPIDDFCDKFEFEKLRYRYYKTGIMPCNWKVGQGFFNEFYHVQQSHPQLLNYVEDYSNAGAYGRHGAMWYVSDGALPYRRSSRLPKIPEPDMREHIRGVTTEFHNELGAMASGRAYRALERLDTDIPSDTPQGEVLTRWGEILVEEAIKDGAGWPMELTAEYVEASHLDWQIFPNSIYLHGAVDSVIWYRFRPNGYDPDSCIMDIWSLERYAEGKAPPLKREFYSDWRDPAAKWGRILEQDFANMLAVQKGSKSRAFAGSLLNPVQETAVSNLYRSIRQFMNEGPRAGTYQREATALAAE
ncbi:aromatic ring-hydroxylating dioxygenase subunit alpha (plasmid) [Sphingomonas paeninsulae]|uniref:Aromatic ring-hydroxylating dioxygenase subunit alpha n=1 Tax=Sphingomonas paeninsulae TaxID=2319844 RepID=A0A494T8B6_SPHPE|nr:aromatic ring-hydroxylating dioxygenase subunit alpha [Sphingomonas paeninsulae]AYJ85150.1 aromatic ring-hydroxylating dioxygenase subunit alpha [Sphingomonas paeninsulae]